MTESEQRARVEALARRFPEMLDDPRNRAIVQQWYPLGVETAPPPIANAPLERSAVADTLGGVVGNSGGEA